MRYVTRAQVREIDRRSIEEFHIPGIVLMENASRAVADVVESMGPFLDGTAIVILCGGGNNGGDGLAVARHLHNRGYNVTVNFAVDPATLKGDALIQWQIVQAMKLPAFYFDPTKDLTGLFIIKEAHFIIDALLGTGLSAAPRGTIARFIETCNGIPPEDQIPIVAIDLPSGLDCDTGVPLEACVRATRTVTFVAEKAGFANPQAKPWLGEVTIGDIGCPRELIDEVARSSP